VLISGESHKWRCDAGLIRVSGVCAENRATGTCCVVDCAWLTYVEHKWRTFATVVTFVSSLASRWSISFAGEDRVCCAFVVAGLPEEGARFLIYGMRPSWRQAGVQYFMLFVTLQAIGVIRADYVCGIFRAMTYPLRAGGRVGRRLFNV